MFGLHWLCGKPTQDQLETARAITLLKSWKITGRYISLDPVEIMASENYQRAIREIRQLEADDSWAC